MLTFHIYPLFTLKAVLMIVLPNPSVGAAADLLSAVTFYASFDTAVRGDFGGGELSLSTRSNHKTEKGAFIFEKGFPKKAFRIAPGKGIAGGALEVVDVLPANGRIFFPAKGNIAYRKGGWSGTLSVWINHDPDTQLKTGFCDPVQITQKGAGNGAIWFDYNDAKPHRNLRMCAWGPSRPLQRADRPSRSRVRRSRPWCGWTSRVSRLATGITWRSSGVTSTPGKTMPMLSCSSTAR